MQPAIRIDNLGKQYRVEHNRPRGGYRTLRETLVEVAGAPVRRVRGQPPPRTEDFWALRDVSFEVQPGEVVGIIGRNGAGKSTLLKVLSRITKPTTGRVEINGRVGSLLEVGTGFHPELTGRENIYLNGSILGMSKKEIDRRFDEIVDFAEVEKFLDTPVKRYSSGMYVRLAFAVAAHLEPEILIIDEVLAVGDAEFQQKCLGRMRAVGREGRTVFFVSHNMGVVQNLCQRVIVLKEGEVLEDGEADGCISNYLKAGASEGGSVDLSGGEIRHRGSRRFFTRLESVDVQGQCTGHVRAGDALTFQMQYEWTEPLLDPRISISITAMNGTKLLVFGTRWNKGLLARLPPTGNLRCHVPELLLMPGKYAISLACGVGADAIEVLEGIMTLTVDSHDYFATGQFPKPQDGHFLGKAVWDVQSLKSFF